MVTEEQVLESLSAVIDPDLGKDIVTLGFVKEVKISGGTVSFTVELTTPACPVKEQFRTTCESIVLQLPGIKKVDVNFTAMPPRQKAGPTITSLEQVECVIAVSSCKGGVGKSTVAAHLARAIQREGLSVGLLDVDIYGPSVPTLFKSHQARLYARDKLIQPIEVDGLKTMSLGYVMGDKPAVMRGPMVSNYTTQILNQTDWGALNYLIIDMPPGTGDIQLTLVQQAAIDGAVIVTTPQALSLVDVARGILMFETVNVPVLGLVENMAYFECDNCNKQHAIFGSSTATLKERFGLNTLAELPILQGVSDTSSRTSGSEIAAFAKLAENLHREVGKRRVEVTRNPVATAEDTHVHVSWPDDMESRIPNKPLRVSCQCAVCVNEYTDEPILKAESIPEDIKVDDIRPLGNYAISITWSDGHSSGIFSWAHLRNMADSLSV